MAIGECRYDTHRASQQEEESVLRVQESAFKMQLRLAEAHKFVLHIRAWDRDAKRLSALYSQAIMVMREVLTDQDNGVYLHSFVGCPDNFSLWIKAFP